MQSLKQKYGFDSIVDVWMEDTACCSNTNGCNENSEPQWRTTVGNGRKFNRKDATVFDEFLAQDEIKRIVNSCTTTYMPLKKKDTADCSTNGSW